MAVGNWTICQANSTRTLYNIPTVMPAITVTLIYRVHNEGPAAVNVVPPDTGSVIRLDPGESCDVVGAPWINVALAGLPRRNVSTTLRQPAFEFKLGFPAFGLAG
jgi:hypothetical protein